MYGDVLKDEVHGNEAIKQVCTLAGILDATFKKGCDNIFETWIKVGFKYRDRSDNVNSFNC